MSEIDLLIEELEDIENNPIKPFVAIRIGGYLRNYKYHEYRIAELEAAQRWIPVSEPPKIDGTYLLRNIYEDVYSCDFIADTNTWVLSEYDSITHWMPLPQPPEVQE